MDKSNSTTVHSPYMQNDYINAKAYVTELKVCTQDPARYLQRCIARSTGGSCEYPSSYVTPNSSNSFKELKCVPSSRTVRDIYVSKREFLSEKPDHGMITNMITSRAPGNFYSSQKWPTCTHLTHGVNTPFGGTYFTSPTGIAEDNKTETAENPKKLLLKMLQSTAISGKKKKSSRSKVSRRKRRKKKHPKTRRPFAQMNLDALKERKIKNSEIKVPKASENNTKAVTRISLPNVANQTEKSPTKSNSMIHKMLEETEERLRITFLSNIRCSSDAATTPTPLIELLEKSDMFQLVNSFISQLLSCARDMPMEENNRHSGSTYISTTVARKSNPQVKKSLKNCQSRSSTVSRRRDSNNSVSERKPTLVREPSLTQKSKNRQRKDRLSSVGLGRPGKDDTEEAEFAHCTIEPDPPSAISAPYCETNSSTKTVIKSSVPRDSTVPKDSNAQEEKPSYTSNYLQRFREPILDHGNKTKILPQQYNSKISYVCASTELNLKGKEADNATENVDKRVTELSVENQNASNTSLKKPDEEQKSKTTQSAEKKTNVKANISKAIGKLFSKSFAEKRSQQRKASDSRNKLGSSAVQVKQPSAFRSNNKQLFKKQNVRKASSNTFTKPAVKPRMSSSYTSGASRPARQHRRYSPPVKDNIRLNAEASAQKRFFNRNEHLLFLARPISRYVEDTKERYREVLDPYHVRNLNTIIFCNQAELHRLKQKRELLRTEAFIQNALRNRGDRKIFDDLPGAPNVSEASCSSDSEHSICKGPDTVLDLGEKFLLQEIPIPETRRKSTLSIISEEDLDDVENVDTLSVSVYKRDAETLSISSVVSNGEEVVCKERTVQTFDTTAASVIESDYRVSDRFQVKDVDESKNEVNEDNFFVLPNAEISCEQPESLWQSANSVSSNLDNYLELQLYIPVEGVASNISTFTTVFEGMQLTLKDMQENCHPRSIACNREYITEEEMQNDCIEALLRVKESSKYPEKYFHQNNSQYVMRCEITNKLYNKNLGMLYQNSESFAKISSNKEKKYLCEILITTNINDTPFFFNDLRYTTVLQINPGTLLQDYIYDPDVLNSDQPSLKVFENIHNNDVECSVSDTNINMTDFNIVIQYITSLLLVKVFQNIEKRENLLSAATIKIQKKSPLSEERVIIDTSNPNFGFDEGQIEMFDFGQNIFSSERSIDCTPLIPRVFNQKMFGKVPGNVEERREEQATATGEVSLMDKSCLLSLQNSERQCKNKKFPQRFQKYFGTYSCNVLQEDSDTKYENLTTTSSIFNKQEYHVKENPLTDFSKFDHIQLDNRIHKKIILVDNSSGEVISYTVVPQPVYAENCLHNSQSNISVLGEYEDNVKESNQTCSTEFKPMSLCENLSSAKKITHHFENEININKSLRVNNSIDTGNYDKCFSKENISHDFCLKGAESFQERHRDNLIDESRVYGSPSDKSCTEFFTKLINTLKNTSECKTTVTKRSVVLKNFFEKSKISKMDSIVSEDGHCSDFHSVHHMLWDSSSEPVNRDQNCKPEVYLFSGKVANDATSASSWHGLTILDSTKSSRMYKLRNDEEPACSSKQEMASSRRVSKTTQTDMTQGIRKCLRLADVPKELSSSTQQTTISNTVKVALMTFTCALALCAVSVLPSMHAITHLFSI